MKDFIAKLKIAYLVLLGKPTPKEVELLSEVYDLRKEVKALKDALSLISFNAKRGELIDISRFEHLLTVEKDRGCGDIHHKPK